jgi:HEAT repeat protein
MSASLEQLAARLRSDDPDERALALGELIEQGAAATPVLLAALDDPNAAVRALAAEGLGLTGAAASADRLAAALADGDGKVRSNAAAALARLGDPRAVDALIRTLDDNYDLLRAHLTQSAYALMGMGPSVLPAVAPLLQHENERIRTQAQWIINWVASQQQAGDWSGLQALMADYAPDGPPAERERVAEAVTAWLRHAPAAEADDA